METGPKSHLAIWEIPSGSQGVIYSPVLVKTSPPRNDPKKGLSREGCLRVEPIISEFYGIKPLNLKIGNYSQPYAESLERLQCSPLSRVIHKMMMKRRHTRILIVMHQKWGSIGKVVLVVL